MKCGIYCISQPMYNRNPFVCSKNLFTPLNKLHIHIRGICYPINLYICTYLYIWILLSTYHTSGFYIYIAKTNIFTLLFGNIVSIPNTSTEGIGQLEAWSVLNNLYIVLYVSVMWCRENGIHTIYPVMYCTDLGTLAIYYTLYAYFVLYLCTVPFYINKIS